MITIISYACWTTAKQSPSATKAKAASNVRMREKPSKEAKSLRTLEAGTKVEVLLRGEGWTIVKYKNQTGYVMSRYLQFP